MGHMSLHVTFAPTMDDIIRTSLSKEDRIALRSHKALFHQGGFVLNVTSSIYLTPMALFRMMMLTLLCLDEGDMVPTPTDRPRLVSDVITSVRPQGHAPSLHRMLLQTAEDTMDGARPLPRLPPSLNHEDNTIV